MFRLFCLVIVTLISIDSGRSIVAAEPLLTVAEKSNYQTTSKYADVVAFCQELGKLSPTVKVSSIGKSQQGRELPLLIISEPTITSAAEAEKAGKLVVLVFANIHAGEVDGKEAVLALARDITAKKGDPLLKDLVLLVVPIFNADGNEPISTKNRTEQNGPKDGVGLRENAQGLDLNRDYIKLETPEVRALVKLMNAWDPAMVIDCHTTNGSHHRFTLTFDGPRYPTTDTSISQWSEATLFPEVTQKVKRAANFDLGPYGNFSGDRTKWETYPTTPRFGTQYVAIRGRIGVLSESYSYATFEDRVKSSYAFVQACLEVAAARKEEIRKLIEQDSKIPQSIVVRTKAEAFPKKRAILGFEEKIVDGRRVSTDTPKDYSLDYIGKVAPTELVKRPAGGYLIPADCKEVIETVRRHGIKVEELREDLELEVEIHKVKGVEMAARPFQKHKTATVTTTLRTQTQRVPAGTMLVRCNQPLTQLACFMLEPHSEDGLATWNFFDDVLTVGKDFPVLRVSTNIPMTVGKPRPLPENLTAKKAINEDIPGGIGGRAGNLVLAGNPASGFQWLPDGEHFLQPKEDKLWKVQARTGRAELFVDPDLLRKSLAANPKVRDSDQIMKSVPSKMSPDMRGMLIDIGPDLGLAYFDGRPTVQLTKSDGAREFVTFSPDSKKIAFVRGGNLFSVDGDTAVERQLTFDGGGEIINGRGDWVYEEEIFNRKGQAYWWSPDGAKLAYLRFDDRPVRKFNILDLQGMRGKLETYPYPKAGEPNPHVKIGVLAASGDKPILLKMGSYSPDDTLISRVGWLPSSKGIYAYIQNRTQTWLDLVFWENIDAAPKVIFRDSTKAWIADCGELRFFPDGSFLYLSERDGWKHIYHYSSSGELLRQIDAGENEVKEIVRVDSAERAIYFTGTRDGSTRSHLYRAKLDGNRVYIERLTPVGGSHQITMAPAGPLFIDHFTDDLTPTRVALFGGTEKLERMLDTNPVHEREEYQFCRFESLSVPMKDGFQLDGTITYPPDFDKSKRYPIWVFTYAGPHNPTVREGWTGGRILEQTIATSGIIAFRVDPRSSSGKGAVSAWTCYKQFGVQELKDLEEAVGWIGANAWADTSRVGISGHSFGGFMASYALTHGKVFSAGIASGPVTDWALYDSIYTERYMLTPKENPDGYERSSVVKAAKNLHGKLLIVHGMIDDNVHLQNSVHLADALQTAGKDFELMFYPKSRHGLTSTHYHKLQIDFIRRTMGVK